MCKFVSIGHWQSFSSSWTSFLWGQIIISCCDQFLFWDFQKIDWIKTYAKAESNIHRTCIKKCFRLVMSRMCEVFRGKLSDERTRSTCVQGKYVRHRNSPLEGFKILLIVGATCTDKKHHSVKFSCFSSFFFSISPHLRIFWTRTKCKCKNN